MSLDGQSAAGQGNVLAFTVTSWAEALTVTCTVTAGKGVNATATKRLQVLGKVGLISLFMNGNVVTVGVCVIGPPLLSNDSCICLPHLAGPANVSISGPDLMDPSVSHTYSCHAYCRPSCAYAWKTDKGPWMSGQGNVISITPQEMDSSRVLICKATNSVSKLFVGAVRSIAVICKRTGLTASGAKDTFSSKSISLINRDCVTIECPDFCFLPAGPAKVEIIGPDVIELAEKYTYVCSAECVPACRYASSMGNQTVRGGVMEIMVDHPLKSVTLKCEAQNTASRRTAVASKTVQIARRF